MLFLKQEITRMRRLEKTQLELKEGNGEVYEVLAIWDSAVYKKKLESSQLSRLYYLVLLKVYFKEKNI